LPEVLVQFGTKFYLCITNKSSEVVVGCREIYGEFAQLCFQLFGDRVKHWITFNEIHSFAGAGYFSGKNAPGRCSAPYGNCTQGNSLTEPYIVAHNALNAHALAVNIYKTQFKVLFLY
jgi:beta-glucosidase/6-phospho-beta-glucosidase/beta-galactosidase